MNTIVNNNRQLYWSVSKISLDFNQKFDQLGKKYREKKVDDINQAFTLETIKQEIISNQLANSDNFISIGGGKEALVFVTENNNRPICIKAFRPYSSSNVKRTKQQYHITTLGMANIMAKTEFRNLRILKHFDVRVPKPLEYKNSLAFSMKMVRFNNDSDFMPAPLLKELNLNKFTDPGDFLEQTLDQIELMFKNALMVHGDLSEFNILVTEIDQEFCPVIIDVSQSRLYNDKTFTTTPVRIRIDQALKVIIRDIEIVLNHFETKYKINFSHEDIYAKMFSELPQFAKKRRLLDPDNLFQQKPSKTAWMNMDEINTFTSRKLKGKEKKIQNIFRSLN